MVDVEGDETGVEDRSKGIGREISINHVVEDHYIKPNSLSDGNLEQLKKRV